MQVTVLFDSAACGGSIAPGLLEQLQRGAANDDGDSGGGGSIA